MPDRVDTQEPQVIAVDQLITSARTALEKQGYKVDPETPAFKNYDKERRERSGVYKVRAFDGTEGVAKVSGVDDESRKSINHESEVYDFIAQVPEVSLPGDTQVHFPKKIGQFQTEAGQEGMITSFEKDDSEFKKGLTPEQRTDLMVSALEWLGKQDVPSELIVQEWQKDPSARAVEILGPDQMVYMMEQQYLPGLTQAGVVNTEQAKMLVDYVKANYDLLKKYPPKLTHGDLHMANLAVSRDEASDKTVIGIIDAEALKVSNQFLDLAHIANRLPVYRELMQRDNLPVPDSLRVAMQDVLGLMDDPDLVERLESALVRTGEDKAAYKAMKIYDALTYLYDHHQDQDPLTQMALDSYKRNLATTTAA